MSRVQDDLAARLDAGITLPFSWFADPEIFRAEQERIFAAHVAVRRAHLVGV